MKKIVAIVLAMVMVMGLATTAFAAGVTNSGSQETNSVTAKQAALYTLASSGNGVATPTSMTKTGDVTTIAKTTVTGKIDNDVVKYVPAIYNIDNTFYIQVAKASASVALKNDGAYTYLAPATKATAGTLADVIAKYATDVVMAKFVAPVEVVSCGDAVEQRPYYVSAEGDLYYVGGTDFAYMNGEFVAYNAASENLVALQGHEWKDTKVTYRGTDALGHAIPVSIKCAECEKTFAIVGAAKFDNTWVEGVNYETYGKYFIVLDAATAAAPSAPAAGETVESAKTFDAGIAMYVGMSVMAAAGSAVVLKKKD